jgi:RimJ/RimL family protein N-acetyltransferase
MALVVGLDLYVTTWVALQLGYTDPPPAYTSIGFEREGELVAGIYFDGMSDTNVFAHIASNGRLLPRELLDETCRFVYDRLGAKRMTFMVYDTNERCLSFIKALGAEYESRIAEGHSGGDVLLYVLWADRGYNQRRLARLSMAEPA